MSLGDVQAFIQYSRQFTMPITQLAAISNVFQSAIASAERVFELLDEAEEIPDAVEPVPLGRVAGRIELENVSFRYEPETPLIDDLDLEVAPGETVAIVGPTGAGKTTLVNLLMRFYEIDAGTISIDGIDIRDVTRDDLRRDVRDGPPGHLAVRRDDPRQHRLRRDGRQRGADRRRGPGRPRRPLRADAGRRLRHRDRRRRVEPVAGREAAADDRPGLPGGPAASSSSTRRPARSTPGPRCSSSARWPG